MHRLSVYPHRIDQGAVITVFLASVVFNAVYEHSHLRTNTYLHYKAKAATNQYIYRKYLPTFLIAWAFKKPEAGCSANGVLKLRAIIRMFFSCVYPGHFFGRVPRFPGIPCARFANTRASFEKLCYNA